MSGFDGFITFCYVERIEPAARFYGEVLGLPLALDQGGCRLFQVAGKGYVGVCERPGRPTPEGVLLTLVTDDVDGWHTRLEAAGVPIDEPPRANADYGIYHFFARDPDGYRIEIQRFVDPPFVP